MTSLPFHYGVLTTTTQPALQHFFMRPTSSTLAPVRSPGSAVSGEHTECQTLDPQFTSLSCPRTGEGATQLSMNSMTAQCASQYALPFQCVLPRWGWYRFSGSSSEQTPAYGLSLSQHSKISIFFSLLPQLWRTNHHKPTSEDIYFLTRTREPRRLGQGVRLRMRPLGYQRQRVSNLVTVAESPTAKS